MYRNIEIYAINNDTHDPINPNHPNSPNSPKHSYADIYVHIINNNHNSNTHTQRASLHHACIQISIFLFSSLTAQS